jgi:transcriptional regulator with XRE-family HTH domain
LQAINVPSIGKIKVTVDQNVSARLHHRRKELRVSLRQLAAQSNLSASFLSQVEHGKAMLSLHSLQSIAEALQVPLLYFLSDSDPTPLSALPSTKILNQNEPDCEDDRINPVIRYNRRPKLILPLSGVEYELLVPSSTGKMVAITGSLSPGTGNVARRLREPTEELIYVISGKLKVILENRDYVLCPGDTIYFEGGQLSELICASDEIVRWISIITPAVF